MIYTWAADVAPLLDPIIYEAYYREVPQWRQRQTGFVFRRIGH